MRLLWLLLLAGCLGGCVDPVDPRWSLNHDHVVVARATPPTIRAGEMTNLDALVAHVGRAPTIENPLGATMARTDGSMGTLAVGADACLYTAPAVLPAVKGIAADGPMGVDVLMTFARNSDRSSLDKVQVKKTVWLGDPAANPEVPAVTIGGAAAGEALSVPVGEDVYVSVDAPDAWRVNWLTSVGTLFQDDEHTAYLNVEPADGKDGWFAVVIRDDHGGVAWRVWPISAQ